MSRKRIEDRNVRKLAKKKSGSYTVTLPIEIVRELSWRDGQKLTMRKSGSKIIIEDWKK